MTQLITVLLVILTALPVAANPPKDRLTHRPAGFSIAPLAAGAASEQWQPLAMSLPARDGFSPNVNVIVQPFAQGLDAYMNITLGEFKKMGLTLIGKKKPSAAVLVLEYAGKLNGRELHFYAKATKRGKQVYLVTATALKTQWPALSAQLKQCVDSFELQ